MASTKSQTKTKKKKKNFQSIYEDDDFSLPEIPLDTKAKPPKLEKVAMRKDERRADPRYALHFEAIVFCKGASFRSSTVNISITGLMLERSIPKEFINQHLDIVLIGEDGKTKDYFLFSGRCIGKRLRTPRIEFERLKDSQIKQLQALFEDLTSV